MKIRGYENEREYLASVEKITGQSLIAGKTEEEIHTLALAHAKDDEQHDAFLAR